MTNHDKRSWELQQISGSFRQLGGVERFLRNTTTQRFSLVLPPTSLQPMHVPYKVSSTIAAPALTLAVQLGAKDGRGAPPPLR